MDFPEKHSNYHSDIVRSKLIRIIPEVFQDIHDELVLALNDIIIPTVDEGMPQTYGKPFASS